MTPLESAEYEIQVQRSILWGQREGLRHSLGPLGNRATPDEWRAMIRETEARLRDAESLLADARAFQEMTAR
jgi:hypothetical protein